MVTFCIGAAGQVHSVDMIIHNKNNNILQEVYVSRVTTTLHFTQYYNYNCYIIKQLHNNIEQASESYST